MKYIIAQLVNWSVDTIIIGENHRWVHLPDKLSNCALEMAQRVTNSDNPELICNGKNEIHFISEQNVSNNVFSYLLTNSNILLKVNFKLVEAVSWFWLQSGGIGVCSKNDLDFYRNAYDLYNCSEKELKDFILWIRTALSDIETKDELNMRIFRRDGWINFIFK